MSRRMKEIERAVAKLALEAEAIKAIAKDEGPRYFHFMINNEVMVSLHRRYKTKAGALRGLKAWAKRTLDDTQ